MLCRRSFYAAVMLACVSGCALAGLERSIVFQPEKYPAGNWQTDATVEDAVFESPDGLRLHGWFAPAPQPRAVVLYCHGNTGSISGRQSVLDLFRNRLRTTVLIFDYRGYGRSEGEPTAQGILSDARAARRWLAARTGVPETAIVLVGNSLGGAVAVDLAQDGARALVLENTFSSLPDVAASHFKFLPVRWLLTTRLDSQSKIAAYHGPLLQTHGDADQVVPFASGRELFDAANEPKQFVAIPGGGHNDLPAEEYLRALDRFLHTLPSG